MKIKVFAVAGAMILAALTMAPQTEAGSLGCIVGAAAGGFGGSKIGKGTGQLAAVALGTLVGCGVGSRIQDSDQRAYNGSQYGGGQQYGTYNGGSYNGGRIFSTVPQARPWRNPDYGNARYVQPPQYVQRQVTNCPSGYTREYTTKITVGGKQVPAYGTACWQPDGSWQMGPAVESR